MAVRKRGRAADRLTIEMFESLIALQGNPSMSSGPVTASSGMNFEHRAEDATLNASKYQTLFMAGDHLHPGAQYEFQGDNRDT